MIDKSHIQANCNDVCGFKLYSTHRLPFYLLFPVYLYVMSRKGVSESLFFFRVNSSRRSNNARTSTSIKKKRNKMSSSVESTSTYSVHRHQPPSVHSPTVTQDPSQEKGQKKPNPKVNEEK